MAKQPGSAGSHQGIHRSKEQTGSHHAQFGSQQDRKQEGRGQSPEIIEGKDLGDEVLELEPVFENSQEKGNFQPYQNADYDDQEIKEGLQRPGIRKRQKQDGCGKPADDPHQNFDGDELSHQPLANKAGKVGSEAHGKKVGPDNGRELGNGVPQQITGEGSGDQFINQPTGSDNENRKKEGVGHVP